MLVDTQLDGSEPRSVTFETQEELEKYIDRQGAGGLLPVGSTELVTQVSKLRVGTVYALDFAKGSIAQKLNGMPEYKNHMPVPHIFRVSPIGEARVRWA